MYQEQKDHKFVYSHPTPTTFTRMETCQPKVLTTLQSTTLVREGHIPRQNPLPFFPKMIILFVMQTLSGTHGVTVGGAVVDLEE